MIVPILCSFFYGKDSRFLYTSNLSPEESVISVSEYVICVILLKTSNIQSVKLVVETVIRLWTCFYLSHNFASSKVDHLNHLNNENMKYRKLGNKKSQMSAIGLDVGFVLFSSLGKRVIMKKYILGIWMVCLASLGMAQTPKAEQVMNKKEAF